MIKKLSIGLIVILATCGGSVAKTLAERFSFQAEASAWENHMPGGQLPGQKPCTPITILFKVVANRPLPADISAKSISLGKNASVLWAQDVLKAESRLSNERTIEGSASGCRTSALSEGDTFNVKIILSTSNERSEVETTVKLLVVS